MKICEAHSPSQREAGENAGLLSAHQIDGRNARYRTEMNRSQHDAATTGRSQLRSRLVRIGGIVILLVTAVAFVAILHSVQTALTAERNLHAVLNTITACNIYLTENDGKWPSSWADIDPLMSEERDWGVHDCVTVDFNADPCELATQDSNRFTGITVESPVYIHYGEIDVLLTTLRVYHCDAQTGG